MHVPFDLASSLEVLPDRADALEIFEHWRDPVFVGSDYTESGIKLQ